MEHLQIELYRCRCPERSDILSKERTTGFLDKQLLSRFSDKIPMVLPGWLENPVEDWTLVDRIVEHVAQLQ
jgi:hypothetical protein